MPEATNTIEIARPAEEVFAFLADPTNDPQWRAGVLDIRLRSGSGQGAVYEQGVKGPFGRRVPADVEITALEPNRLIGFRAVAGPVRPEGRYELEPSATGTRVRFTLSCSPSGAKRLMTPMVTKAMHSEVSQLERLRDVLET
jgi:uncharacterized protein YndB with AHSA1/START domain